MLARPGAGKSTQARRIADLLGVAHLSVGQLLRQEVATGSELGRSVAPALERGDLAPDELVVGIVVARLAFETAAGGYVLDGFPRDLVQVERFAQVTDQAVQPQVALTLNVSPEECRRRLLARAGQEGRADDTAETIEERLRAYELQTAPVLEHYRRAGILVTVDGEDPSEVVTARFRQRLRLD